MFATLYKTMMSIINQNVYIMEKIDILNSALAESGLTAEAVIKSWYEDNQVSAEFLQQLCPVGEKTTFQDMNFIPSKKFVTPKKVVPGMFYYADGLIFPELIKDNQVSAIVGCVDKRRGFALGLRETVLPWSSDWLYVDIPTRLSGKEATALILKAAQKVRKNAEAAEWCAEYAFDGIKAGTGFMPSKEELKRIFGNRKKLRESFALLNSGGLSGNCLQEDAFYWSSSESRSYIGNIVWVVRPSDGSLGYYAKHSRGRVRCVVEFKI